MPNQYTKINAAKKAAAAEAIEKEKKPQVKSDILKQIAEITEAAKLTITSPAPSAEELLVSKSLDLFGQLYYDMNSIWEGLKEQRRRKLVVSQCKNPAPPSTPVTEDMKLKPIRNRTTSLNLNQKKILPGQKSVKQEIKLISKPVKPPAIISKDKCYRGDAGPKQTPGYNLRAEIKPINGRDCLMQLQIAQEIKNFEQDQIDEMFAKEKRKKDGDITEQTDERRVEQKRFQRTNLHTLAQRVFYFHMKDKFVVYLAKDVPNDVQHMNINRKPNYNTFRGIWSHLTPKIKENYDELSMNLVKCGIHETQMKKLGDMTEFFKDFLAEACLANQQRICEHMLDSYKVLIGDKINLNGDGFERLKEEKSQNITSYTNSIDPMHDECHMDSQKLEIYRRKKFSAKIMNFTQDSE